ncbi:MAG: hypothetical protein WBB69_08435 [Anaerolineales bacterium]
MADGQSKFDFEKNWRDKLSRAVEENLGEEIRDQVLQDGDSLSDDTPSEEKIRWTCEALDRLGGVTDEKTRQDILAQCACQYPKEDLLDVKRVYQASGNIDLVVSMLGDKFELFLRESLELEEELIEAIVRLGWGLAGVRKGNTIIATKIPKSGFLEQYFNEADPLEKRRYYCHCPRVREGLGREPDLPEEYCYCGAGFYKGIWEAILGQPVEVETLESVLQGDEVCKIAINLP